MWRWRPVRTWPGAGIWTGIAGWRAAMSAGAPMRALLGFEPGRWLADASDLWRKAASDQGRRSGMKAGRDMARDPVQLFVKHLRAVLAGHPCWLASDQDPMADGSFYAPKIPGYGPQAVGWQIGRAHV